MTKIKVDKKDSFYESVRLDKSTIATATLICVWGHVFPVPPLMPCLCMVFWWMMRGIGQNAPCGDCITSKLIVFRAQVLLIVHAIHQLSYG